jgi:hypothetical protein
MPLFGNLLWLRNSVADMEPLLQKLGLVVTLRMGSRLAIFVADRRLAHAALVGAGAVMMANRPQAATSSLLGVSDNIITRADYRPVWRLLRRSCTCRASRSMPSPPRSPSLSMPHLRRGRAHARCCHRCGRARV